MVPTSLIWVPLKTGMYVCRREAEALASPLTKLEALLNVLWGFLLACCWGEVGHSL